MATPPERISFVEIGPTQRVVAAGPGPEWVPQNEVWWIISVEARHNEGAGATHEIRLQLRHGFVAPGNNVDLTETVDLGNNRKVVYGKFYLGPATTLTAEVAGSTVPAGSNLSITWMFYRLPIGAYLP